MFGAGKSTHAESDVERTAEWLNRAMCLQAGVLQCAASLTGFLSPVLAGVVVAVCMLG